MMAFRAGIDGVDGTMAQRNRALDLGSFSVSLSATQTHEKVTDHSEIIGLRMPSLFKQILAPFCRLQGIRDGTLPFMNRCEDEQKLIVGRLL
jgi:hypothetical protein